MTSLISTMANSICEDAKVDGEYAALPAVPALKPEVLGPWLIILNNGTALRALSRTLCARRRPEVPPHVHQTQEHDLRPEYWVPEAAHRAIMAGEHGQFEGHLHAFTGALVGLLWYASLTNNLRLKQFVHESYQFVRTFGIAPMGQFGEQCVTGDMTWRAIKMSDLGVGDYWEDVDQYVRNQLVEGQVSDAAAMHRCNATMPPLVEMANPEYVNRRVRHRQCH